MPYATFTIWYLRPDAMDLPTGTIPPESTPRVGATSMETSVLMLAFVLLTIVALSLTLRAR
jgi:hypothetical protein